MKKLLMLGDIFVNIDNVNTIEFKKERTYDSDRQLTETGFILMEVHCTNKAIINFVCTPEETNHYKVILGSGVDLA